VQRINIHVCVLLTDGLLACFAPQEDGVKKQLQREVEIHSRCSHPNIVKFMCYLQDKDRVYMVMEYCSKGSLYALMQK